MGYELAYCVYDRPRGQGVIDVADIRSVKSSGYYSDERCALTEPKKI